MRPSPERAFELWWAPIIAAAWIGCSGKSNIDWGSRGQGGSAGAIDMIMDVGGGGMDAAGAAGSSNGTHFGGAGGGGPGAGGAAAGAGAAGAGAAGAGAAGAGDAGDSSAEAPATVNSDAVPVAPGSRSCALPDGGVLVCNGESCCASIALTGGRFLMGRSTEACGSTKCATGAGFEGCPSIVAQTCNPDEQPEHQMTVGTVALDRYEVTVGRFRNFVSAYAEGWRPSAGAGANPNVPVVGDAADNATGWLAAWDDSATTHTNLPGGLSDFRTKLACDPINQTHTWTDTVGANENRPINCVNWHEAFAFCIWDGGRLPTEAEWEYAAAGGEQNRAYPWGTDPPDCAHANTDTLTLNCSAGAHDLTVAVGSAPKGNGRWGHSDLAGNVWEWVLDWYGDYAPSQTDNYANTSRGPGRVDRGGFQAVRAADRGSADPERHEQSIGLRCARMPATP
jgi:formylglycine-generating enzyme